MHHPCFFDFFYLSHVGGGFRLHSGLFCLWVSDGIAAEHRGDFFASLPSDIHHSSNAVRASSNGRHKKQAGTNRSGFDVKVK